MAPDDRLLGVALTRRDVLATGACTTLAVAAASAAKTQPVGPPAAPAAQRRSEPRIDIVCRDCGGSNVARDAWAEWDVGAQDWVLGPVFDQGFCYDCDREARLEEAEIVAGRDE